MKGLSKGRYDETFAGEAIEVQWVTCRELIMNLLLSRLF